MYRMSRQGSRWVEKIVQVLALFKASHHVDTDRSIDGNKKIKGRKEHIVVDTLGLPMVIKVHETYSITLG